MKQINFLDNPKIRKDIEPLFVHAFPKEERPTPQYFFSCFDKENNQLYAFYDADKFVGFTSLIIFKDVCYIFFLAVSPSLRNQGYGSKILSMIKEMYQSYTILLCYEEIDEKYSDIENRKKREKFYLDNGFKDNGYKTDEFGVIFQTAYFGKRTVSFEEYQEIFKIGFGDFAVPYVKKVTKR